MKIVIFCSTGTTAHLLVEQMKHESEKIGRNDEIISATLASADTDIPWCDAALISPQTMYALRSLRKKYPDKPIVKLEAKVYGTLDGKAALRCAADARRDW